MGEFISQNLEELIGKIQSISVVMDPSEFAKAAQEYGKYQNIVSALEKNIEKLVKQLNDAMASKDKEINDARNKMLELLTGPKTSVEPVNYAKAAAMANIPKEIAKPAKAFIGVTYGKMEFRLPIVNSVSEAKAFPLGEFYIISTKEYPYAPFYNGGTQKKWLMGMNSKFGGKIFQNEFYLCDIVPASNKFGGVQLVTLHNDYMKYKNDIIHGNVQPSTFFIPGANILKLGARFDLSHSRIKESAEFVKSLIPGNPETLEMDLNRYSENDKYIFEALTGHLFLLMMIAKSHR